MFFVVEANDFQEDTEDRSVKSKKTIKLTENNNTTNSDHSNT